MQKINIFKNDSNDSTIHEIHISFALQQREMFGSTDQNDRKHKHTSTNLLYLRNIASKTIRLFFDSEKEKIQPPK